MTADDVHEERALLRSLMISDYGEFKLLVLGDCLQTLPTGKSTNDLIEDFLRTKYATRYEPEVD